MENLFTTISNMAVFMRRIDATQGRKYAVPSRDRTLYSIVFDLAR